MHEETPEEAQSAVDAWVAETKKFAGAMAIGRPGMAKLLHAASGCLVGGAADDELVQVAERLAASCLRRLEVLSAAPAPLREILN